MGTIIKFPRREPQGVEILNPETRPDPEVFRWPGLESAIEDGMKAELQMTLKKLVAFKGEDRATEIVGSVLADACRT